MMLKLTLNALTLVFIVVGLCIGVVRVAYGVVVPLQPSTVFAISGCELPCWMDLRERETTADDVRRILGTYNLDTFGFEWDFTIDADLSGLVQVDAFGNRMGYMILMYHACPVEVLLELGHPDGVIDYNGNGYSFDYFREGITVRVFPNDNYHSARIDFRDPEAMIDQIIVPPRTPTDLSAPDVQAALGRCVAG
ncbi:MAG: hypothetical protein AAF787_17545 [Chloroflexota bacterium]